MLIIINVTNSTITGIKIQSFSLKSSDLILNKWQNYLKRKNNCFKFRDKSLSQACQITLIEFGIIPGIFPGSSVLFVIFRRGLGIPGLCISGGRKEGSPICGMFGIGSICGMVGTAPGDRDRCGIAGRAGDFCRGRVP